MEESFYHKVANEELAKLLEFVEMLEEKTDVEVELDSGILTITLPKILYNRRQYVINKHMPSRQIWVSSPLSGASYFEYIEDNLTGQWLQKNVPGTKTELFSFLKAELAPLLGN